jgi:hypothetical protein
LISSPTQISTSTGVVQTIGFVLRLAAVVATDGYDTDHVYRKKCVTRGRHRPANFSDDYETSRAYAVEFLRSCDGTVGWSSLLVQIAAHMIRIGGTYAENRTQGCCNWVHEHRRGRLFARLSICPPSRSRSVSSRWPAEGTGPFPRQWPLLKRLFSIMRDRFPV